MNVFIWLEKYGLLFIMLFCLGVYTPDFTHKISMMDHELDVVTDSLAESNSFKQIFWVLLSMFFVFRFIINTEMNKLKSVIINKMFLFFVICTIAFLSASWSSYPMISMKRAIFQMLFCTSVSLALCFSYFHRSIEINLKCTAIICIVMILLSLIQGAGFNEDLNLAGYTKSKNTMGLNLAVLIIISHMWVKSLNIDSRFLYVTLGVLFVFLILTQSKTSIILCIGYFLLTQVSLSKIKVFMTVFSVLFFCVFILIPGISYHLSHYQHIALYVDADFITGRGVIWDALYYDLGFFDKITLGYGYGSYFGVGVIPFVLDDKYSFLQYISSAHNGYLQILLQFGLIGSSVLFIVFFMSMLNATNLYIHAALIIPIFQNVTESSIFRDANIAWFLMLMIILSSSLHVLIKDMKNDSDMLETVT
ncbi:O-antigen ligase domain-containing protein [Moritella marina ATCC 15381]|uniref:O-antigen ligase domain-containing protein n=1 Tax=Moritella marina ATCC 15381 TaxID=1202962 RepID=A0A5J6WJV0_MORMI|nr:O-antigen ligase family protein [Moritella marina]QFI37491.1 O-antigen ligase domain-containing protein [Moritella marina ATCC 15381]